MKNFRRNQKDSVKLFSDNDGILAVFRFTIGQKLNNGGTLKLNAISFEGIEIKLRESDLVKYWYADN